ncbi:MAG TPA: 2-oxoglutarate dehydrogenase E1 component [Ktedonobacteraceae bacterium]|nr:2-oxoglutarate dehydrogenase E1 component [Ktedonobacteraceae bacterium]
MNDLLQTFYGPNAGYVLELYERYQQNPATVDSATRAFFENWSPPIESAPSAQQTALPAVPAAIAPAQVAHILAASALAHDIRSRGHLGAHLDPLGSEPMGDPALLTESHGITDADLTKLPPDIIGGHSAAGASSALEAITNLRAMYSGTISYEFDQVKSPDERQWLRDAVGLRLYRLPDGRDARLNLLRRLTQVESFERFLHTTFPGQKRFSIEGTDVLVPMIDEIIRGAVNTGTREVIIGMAHRGRLNVLAHVLEKPYTTILSEFRHMKHEEGVPLTDTFGFGYTGDVKYHLGAEHQLGEDQGTSVDLKIILSPNPSHLEYVNPVVEGMARATQERRKHSGSPEQQVNQSLPILIHGDAAFPGEGIVAETLNLWNLKGYRAGGTIHIIANNQLGFTTEPRDYRSTHFASDLAKGFAIPIIHVNADDPEAALMAVRIAHAFRDTFHKDILVDLVGYRRWGHNEGDEPAFTQPQMYEIIRAHPTVRELYAQRLQDAGVATPDDAATMQKEALQVLEEARREADASEPEPEEANGQNGHTFVEAYPSPLSMETLATYNAALLAWPEGFTPNPKLERLLKRRAETLGPEGGIDWGQAESLAFAAILADGTAIRLTGQDSERGTFSHRHAVLHDQHSGALYIPLQHLPQARAPFSIYNSPLCESGALGFEYGYSVHAPRVLTLWEAQFGDFANVAQVIIDQFIASARAKWKQLSSLVLLLPHGYEGQGPEHSSARLERYLELSAQDNWRVANCSTAAQYFHLLRLQAFNLERNPRPLVVMTPKSLLRHPFAAASAQELAEDHFHDVLDDRDASRRPDAVRRVVLCTGKMAVDLLGNAGQAEDVAIVRVELLYPFPENALKQLLAHYSRAREAVWVQEEPENMGAWYYMAPRLAAMLEPGWTLQHISRPPQSSPATGFSDLFQLEQETIIHQALHTQASVRSA